VALLAGIFGNQYQWRYFSELWATKLANPSRANNRSHTTRPN
jgi:hypothetical protein